MLLIDIGNTTIKIAFLDEKRSKNGRKLPVAALLRAAMQQLIETTTNRSELKRQLKGALMKISKRSSTTINSAIICSVVPEINETVAKTLKSFFKAPVVIIGEDIKIPIINKYKHPKQVGQDRLVGAFAAKELYGFPSIVVDLGTAITFDAISKRGDYLGGVIVPGLRLSAESLFKKTALLPNIDIKAPSKVIGQTTQDSIISGLFYGYGSLCQGMIEKIAKQMRTPEVKVILTGGHTQLMKRFIDRKIRVVDEDLVLKGLYLLAKKIPN